jgi:hypothetical protein
MGKVKKTIQKVIPKEIKPYLPALAAVLGPAAFAGSGMFASAALASLPVGVQAALASAATSGLTQDKVDLKQAALSGIMSQAGASLKGYGNAGSNIPLESATPKTFLQKAATATGEYLQPSSVNKLFTNEAMTTGEIGSALYSGAKAALPVGGGAAASQYADMNEEALRKYNEELLAKGVQDKTLRRKGIYDIYAGIEDEDTGRVYSDEYINSMLDKYSYAKGGRVAKAKDDPTPIPADDFAKLIEEFIKNQDQQEEIRRQNKAGGGRIGFAKAGFVEVPEEEYLRLKSKEDTKTIQSGLEYATKGFEQALGGPLGGEIAKPTRIVPGFASGGITDIDVGETKGPEGMALNTDLLREYRSYKMEQDDLGVPAIPFREWFEMTYGASRVGAAKGGHIREENVSMTDDDSGVIYHDEKGNTISKKKAMELFDREAEIEYRNKKAKGGIMNASHQGNDDLAESLFQEYLGMGMTPDQAAAAVKDYFDSSKMGLKDGGKVIPLLPEGVFYKGKAKDYPGAHQAIKDALKKKREKKAEGGLLGLRVGGMPAELDYRGGGMIKVGSKEKADDVAARLSKNEFVMTADAVKGVGKGNPRKGAEIMYQLMDKFEAMA